MIKKVYSGKHRRDKNPDFLVKIQVMCLARQWRKPSCGLNAKSTTAWS